MPSVTRNQSRSRERRTAAETQVLAAVSRLLDQGLSFTEISVQRIIDEADIARSTFYVHFRDKSDLLARLAGTIRQRLFMVAREWEPTGPAGGIEGLTATFEELIAFHRENLDVLSAISEIAAYDATVRDFYTTDLECFEDRVRKVLAGERDAGRTDAHLDLTNASRVVVWGGEQAIAHHIGVDDGSGDAAFCRELATIWWHGVYHRPVA